MNDKKKILIIGSSLNIGGAEKSLINLLNMIDYAAYDVDFLLFQKEGAFVKQVPEEVNWLEDRTIKVLYQSIGKTLKQKKLSLRDIGLSFRRYRDSFFETRKWKQFDQIRIHRWMEHYVNYIPENENHYDLAIAYAGGDTAYYMLDKVKADQKVYYFHSDYSKIDIDVELERRYVDRADKIVTISDVCKQSLVNLFPEKASDIYVLNNLSSSKLIKKLACEYKPVEYEQAEGLKIVSVGRLHPIKGFDLAVEAACILKNSGYKFSWVVVGDGEERARIESVIKENHLENLFILVGAKENPYPYIAEADVLVQPSRFEGKSVVLDEAKVLGVPSIITNYNSAHDQIEDGMDGMIVDMSPEGIASGIMNCTHEDIRKFSRNIKVDNKLEDIDGYMNCLFM